MTVYKVMFCPIEIAAQMGNLVQGLSENGDKAIGLNAFQSYLAYNNHIINGSYEEVLDKFNQLKNEYDIFHYFFNSSMHWDFSDIYELKSLGKKFVMHHWGNDVRIRSKAADLSPFLLDPCNPLKDEEMIGRLMTVSSLIDTAIIQDFELYDYVKDYYKNIYVLPIAHDVSGTIPSFPIAKKKIPLIIHAPTQPVFKGTSFIEAALKELSAHGIAFDYRRIENMSNEEARKVYREADNIIDQVLVGSYGMFAVEAMALGKPVVGYIREDLKSMFPSNLPVISASPVTLIDRLIPLMIDGKWRHQVGKESRKYAEEIHDLSKVLPQLLSIYEVVMNT